jgi:DnaK suppressor protein
MRNQITEMLAGLPRKPCHHTGRVPAIESLADELDLAAAHRDREMSLRLLERQGEMFQDIQKALHRIEMGHYGICENCGEAISLDRLKACPAAVLCVDCKREEEARAQKKAFPFMRRLAH